MTDRRARWPRCFEMVSPRWRGPLLVAAGYAAGIVAIAWAIWLARGSDLGQRPAALEWRFVAAAAAIDLATYGCQAWRWRLLLGNAGRLSWFAAARIIFIGLFVSEVLPMRPGEGVRAWLAARRLGVRVAAIVPSIVVERFFDGVLLVASIATMALVAPLPPALAMASRVLGLIVIALGAALTSALVTGHLHANQPDGGGPGSAIRSALAEIAAGIRAIGVARTTAAAFALSCALLAGQIAAFWLAMRACGIDRSFLAAAIVLTIVHLGTAVPATPGNAGTFQIFVILGLTMLGVDRAAAAAFSLAGFVILTAPLWLLGGLASMHTGVSILAIRRVCETPP